MATISRRLGRHGVLHYQVRIRLRGTPPRTATFPTLAEARSWAHTLEGTLRMQRAFPPLEAAQHTLGELLDRYAGEVLRGKSPATVRKQTALLDWWHAQLGGVCLSEVTPACVVACRDRLAQRRAPATVAGYLAVLSHACTVAVHEWQWLEENPCRKVRKPKLPRGRVRYLSAEERPRLLEACQASGQPLLYPVVVLALCTGARKMELLSLTWRDVDLARGRLTLQQTKNGERRTVALVGPALAALQLLAKVRRLDTALVFPRADGRQPVDIRPAWTRALHAAQLADFCFHDLRHTFASYLAMNGASLLEIADLLGHKTLAMVQRYAHLSEQHTASVVAKMHQAIFG
jgi:integrase